jgi:hypothetical protein
MSSFRSLMGWLENFCMFRVTFAFANEALFSSIGPVFHGEFMIDERPIETEEQCGNPENGEFCL